MWNIDLTRYLILKQQVALSIDNNRHRSQTALIWTARLSRLTPRAFQQYKVIETDSSPILKKFDAGPHISYRATNAYHTILRRQLKSWLHLKRINVQIVAMLQSRWALLFLPTFPAAVDRTLLLDERRFKKYPSFYQEIL